MIKIKFIINDKLTIESTTEENTIADVKKKTLSLYKDLCSEKGAISLKSDDGVTHILPVSIFNSSRAEIFEVKNEQL